MSIASDELNVYPLLYWPVLDSAQSPSDAERDKLAAYMKNGGTIFFDLRNGGVDTGATNDALKRILSKLDVPPLEPVPDKHVLTRSFYLMNEFPGRYEGGPLWVESALGEANMDPGTADGCPRSSSVRTTMPPPGRSMTMAMRSTPSCRARTASANSPSAPASTS